MSRKILGNLIASACGLAVGFATVYLSITRLKEPQNSLDWGALIFSGLTTGLLTFFVIWGHFQKDPTPGSSDPQS